MPYSYFVVWIRDPLSKWKEIKTTTTSRENLWISFGIKQNVVEKYFVSFWHTSWYFDTVEEKQKRGLLQVQKTQWPTSWWLCDTSCSGNWWLKTVSIVCIVCITDNTMVTSEMYTAHLSSWHQWKEWYHYSTKTLLSFREFLERSNKTSCINKNRSIAYKHYWHFKYPK